MKRLRWPRPPLILGLVLGALIERYMSISFLRYGMDWALRPGVMVLLACAALIMFSPVLRLLRKENRAGVVLRRRPYLGLDDLAYGLFIAIGVYVLVTSRDWLFNARIGPVVVASTMVIAGGLSLIHKTFFKEVRAAATNGVHMDIGGDPEEELPRRLVLVRAARFYGWFVLFLLSMAVIGLLPTVPLVIMAFMRIEGREPCVSARSSRHR